MKMLTKANEEALRELRVLMIKSKEAYHVVDFDSAERFEKEFSLYRTK